MSASPGHGLLSILARRTGPILLGLLAVGTLPAPAQDALRNAVREDTAYQTRRAASTATPAGWKAGPVYFTPSVSFGVEFTDNVGNSEEKESDLILRPGIQLDGVWVATERSRVSFGFGFGYSKYLENTDLDRAYVSPNSALAYDILIKDVALSFYDNFSYSQDVVSEPSLSGVATLPRYNNTIGTRATWTPGQGVFTLGYAHENVFTTESTNSYLDRATEQLFARAGYRLRPETTTGLEASVALTDYEDPTQRNNANVSFGPFLDWKPRSWLTLNLRGGYVYYEFDPTNSLDHPDPLSSYYAQVSIDHQLTDHLSHQLSAIHDIRVSLDQGSDYVETSTIDYSISWALRENTTVTGHVSYQIGEQPGAGPLGETEDFQRPSFGLAVRQSFTDKFSGNLAYDFYLRDSNLPGRSYDVNRLTLTLNYRF